MPIIESFSPTPFQLTGLLAVLATALVFIGWGMFVTGSRRFAPADPFVGWGVATIAFIAVGVLSSLSLAWVAYALFAGAVPVLLIAVKQDRGHGSAASFRAALWRIFVLAAPLLILTAAMRASQWDEFSQWLPNAQYLLRFDAFPRSDLPPSPSVFPAYPYGLPLVSYLAAKITGSFVENAGAIFNVLLLLFHAVILSHVLAVGLNRDNRLTARWRLLALSMLGVSVLSTTFVQKIVMTSYADSATAATLAVLAVLLWKLVDGLAEDGVSRERSGELNTLAWQAGLIVAVFLNLKQSNLVLLLLLLIGFGVVVLRDPSLKAISFLRKLPALLLPGLIAYGLWRYHVDTHMPGREFSFLPFDKWHLEEAFAILWSMIEVGAKKAPFFIMMFTISAFAIHGFTKKMDRTARLFIPVAVVFLGFNAFLWLTYVASFGLYDALRAASYWRYNIQLGLLGVTGAAFGLAILWRVKIEPRLENRDALKRALIAFPVICVLVLPFALHHKFRFDMRPHKDHMRMAGQAMADVLPADATVGVIDLQGNGFAGVVIKYELTSAAGAGKNIDFQLGLSAYDKIKTAERLEARLNEARVGYVWVHQSSPLIDRVLGKTLDKRSSHLLKRDGDGWIIVRSWPYQGYTDPHEVPD